MKLRPLRRLTAAALTTAAVLVTMGLGVATAPAQAAKPTAVVALGDSFISGEAAGRYEEGTDQSDNLCHRSRVAEIKKTAIAGIDSRINLACSGAQTSNVRLDGVGQYNEATQARQLREVAKAYDVKMVLLGIGGNDVGFGELVLDCVKAYYLIAPRCQDVWATKLGTRLRATAPRIAASLADIRTVMRDAGYADGDYQLVLQSYSSPVTEKTRYLATKTVHGCPIRADDAEWGRDVVVPGFTATMAQVADQMGVRYLDMGPALRGREVCARGITKYQEWVRGITIDATQVRNGVGNNIVQQSLHPNARGHAQFGRCLTGFYALVSQSQAARCVRQADGNLSAIPASLSDLTVNDAPKTLPVQPEPPPAQQVSAAAATG
ncbi:MAG TPA: GDSL-type esterase/lipase family protein [Cryptosporangiaceae bacterium]|nr:GDSL-type esterase/lipase family protein [Cryptosporangiaceae bacterium]